MWARGGLNGIYEMTLFTPHFGERSDAIRREMCVGHELLIGGVGFLYDLTRSQPHPKGNSASVSLLRRGCGLAMRLMSFPSILFHDG